MKLIDGKFYEGDKEVPLEFGNRQQIDLLRMAEEEANKGHLVTLNLNETVTYKMSIDWKCCSCMKLNVVYDWEEYEEYEPDHEEMQEFIEESIACKHCNTQHKLKVDKTDKYYPKYYVQQDTN